MAYLIRESLLGVIDKEHQVSFIIQLSVLEVLEDLRLIVPYRIANIVNSSEKRSVAGNFAHLSHLPASTFWKAIVT